MTFTSDDLNRYATDSSFRPKLLACELDVNRRFFADNLKGSLQPGDEWWQPSITAMRAMDMLIKIRVLSAAQKQAQESLNKATASGIHADCLSFQAAVEAANSALAEAMEQEL